MTGVSYLSGLTVSIGKGKGVASSDILTLWFTSLQRLRLGGWVHGGGGSPNVTYQGARG